MPKALIILPNQLFEDHPGLRETPDLIVLIEDPLFFGDPQYPATFHKQKLWLHRASMARFAQKLRDEGRQTQTVSYRADAQLMSQTLAQLAKTGVKEVIAVDPVDFIAAKRLTAAAEALGLTLTLLPSPGFINTRADNLAWAKGRKRWFMAEFYKSQRRRLDVMMDGDAPQGGQWSFDEDNRKKVPKKMLGEIPALPSINRDQTDLDARDSVLRDFPNAWGSIDSLIYPTSHDSAAEWLQSFLHDRFALFGDYEDAIVEGEGWLWHSVLTPMLNVGLLTPQQVLEATLDHAARHDI
ncbi:MAG: cryptochrome/photolyase family protein, partial [Pseudomonadota bacterium]